jgi:hypothetical protein
MVVFVYDRRFFAIDFGESTCEFLLILVDISLYNGKKMALDMLPFCLHKTMVRRWKKMQGGGSIWSCLVCLHLSIPVRYAFCRNFICNCTLVFALSIFSLKILSIFNDYGCSLFHIVMKMIRYKSRFFSP